MLKSCIWISSWFAGVSCTKVHNVTENKFIFVHTVQETAANVHKFGQLYKITEHHSRQCYDKGRSRMNCIHILRHKAHMHTKNWTNTIAYTVLVSIPAVEDSRSLLSAWGLACMVTSAVFSTRSSGQKHFQLGQFSLTILYTQDILNSSRLLTMQGHTDWSHHQTDAAMKYSEFSLWPALASIVR